MVGTFNNNNNYLTMTTTFSNNVGCSIGLNDYVNHNNILEFEWTLRTSTFWPVTIMFSMLLKQKCQCFNCETLIVRYLTQVLRYIIWRSWCLWWYFSNLNIVKKHHWFSDSYNNYNYNYNYIRSIDECTVSCKGGYSSNCYWNSSVGWVHFL